MFFKKLPIAIALLFSFISFAQNKAYKAGEIYTENEYQYGKMEVRMLAATGSGVISNFFTFKQGSELPSTFWEEIDIEVFGKDGANSWQTNLITGQGNTNLIRTEGVHQEIGLGSSYHTYTIEWRPGHVSWSVDGVMVREINGGQADDITSDTSLRFNIWNPDIPEWVGPFNNNILPVSMFVNWIKFYEWNGSSFSSTPSLEDNFNSFDTNTWTKANHTFQENLSDFVPENVTTKNGYLVLTITKDGETGYEGTPPVDDPIVDTNIPVAEVRATPNSGTVPLTVSFDASQSFDPANEALSYAWDFGDGNTSSGISPTHTYINNGEYTAVVTVTNISGHSDTANEQITVNPVITGTPVDNCLFNTPISTPLASINKSFNQVHVIGNGGPDLSNITMFTINWDLINNGLWQMSFNTNNGSPNWWMDIRSSSSQTFNRTEPTINFSGTRISGFDGEYDVTIVDTNFVLVSKTGNFTIYFSNSATPPACGDKSPNNIKAKNIITSIAPNPSSDSFSVYVNTPIENNITATIYDVSGRKIPMTANRLENGVLSFGEDLNTGFYFLKLFYEGQVIKETTIVKQ